MSQDKITKTILAGDQDALGAVAVTLAQQEGMAGPMRHLAHGTRLFRLPQGWQSRAVAEDKAVAVCETLLQLDAALQDENRRVIFLPLHAMMTEEDIERVCQRHGVAKTLFWEVGAE